VAVTLGQTIPALPVRDAARAVDKPPVRSGAESLIAGTASIASDVDEGTREFATVDIDGNLLTFFRWRES